jgi:hypothetical protein
MTLTHREGLIMYWCEGDKSTESHTYRVALTSCDPFMLKLFTQWLCTYYGVKKAQLKIRLHIWPNVDENLARTFWSKSLDLPVGNFTKSWIKPRGRGVGKQVHAYGICRVSISSKVLLDQIISNIKNEFEC